MQTSLPLHLFCLILYKGLSVPIFPSCFSQTLLDSQLKICRIYNIHVASHIRWGDVSRHISFDELVDNTLWRTTQSSLKPPRRNSTLISKGTERCFVFKVFCFQTNSINVVFNLNSWNLTEVLVSGKGFLCKCCRLETSLCSRIVIQAGTWVI